MPRTILSVDGKVMGATNSSDFQVNVQEKLVRKYKGEGEGAQEEEEV